jgi:hypothetical protein
MTQKRNFQIKVLGRTLELLGVQMYKKRDAAIAELVANCWDAGANRVDITLPAPESYDQEKDVISIEDNGIGMDADEVQEDYLVVGRNTRADGDSRGGRLVMGRIGIGKLAGFGIASCMTILTWRGGKLVKFSLDIEKLKGRTDELETKDIEGELGTAPEGTKYKHGTRIILNNLKHVSPIDIDDFHQSLARRFGRIVKGRMKIYVNGEELKEPELKLLERFPKRKKFETVKLEDGREFQYWYGITENVIRTPFLQGFSVLVRGKVGQIPPFYFNIENSASHQVGTKYFSGEIMADFLDEGTDDESDLVSTDRQEIEWGSKEAAKIYGWGQRKTRDILTEIFDLRGKRVEKWVLEDEPELKKRIDALEAPSQRSLLKVLPVLGAAVEDKPHAIQLADQLIRAYEFRQFKDVVEEIEIVANKDPILFAELLTRLRDWKVLESRALLELIGGRLFITDTLQSFVVNGIPEVASAKSDDNLHDLIARMPWLLNPDWDFYDEEKTISAQLEAWNVKDLNLRPEDARLRYDFVAFSGRNELLIIEIKRSNHPVELEELQRLEKYKDSISKARTEKVIAVLVSGGTTNVNRTTWENYQKRDDFLFLTWAEICDRTKRQYEHYRGVLEGNIEHKDFGKAIREVQQVKTVKDTKTVRRSKKERAEGLRFYARNRNKKSTKKKR